MSVKEENNIFTPHLTINSDVFAIEKFFSIFAIVGKKNFGYIFHSFVKAKNVSVKIDGNKSFSHWWGRDSWAQS